MILRQDFPVLFDPVEFYKMADHFRPEAAGDVISGQKVARFKVVLETKFDYLSSNRLDFMSVFQVNGRLSMAITLKPLKLDKKFQLQLIGSHKTKTIFFISGMSERRPIRYITYTIT